MVQPILFPPWGIWGGKRVPETGAFIFEEIDVRGWGRVLVVGDIPRFTATKKFQIPDSSGSALNGGCTLADLLPRCIEYREVGLHARPKWQAWEVGFSDQQNRVGRTARWEDTDSKKLC